MKIPLLPNKVGKRSRTMKMVTTGVVWKEGVFRLGVDKDFFRPKS